MVDVHRTRNDHDEVDIATTSLRSMTTARRHRMCNGHDAVGIATATPGRCLRSKPNVSDFVPLGLCLLQLPPLLCDYSPLTLSPFFCLREPLCSLLTFPFLSPPELVLELMPKGTRPGACSDSQTSTPLHGFHSQPNKTFASTSHRWCEGCSWSGGSPLAS